MTAVAGILLAGGLGRRMGGGDKCLHQLGGCSLLERAAARARPQVGQLLLNVNGDPGRFPVLDLPVLADAFPDYAGPLAGILAGLEYLGRGELSGAAAASILSPFESSYRGFEDWKVYETGISKWMRALSLTPGLEKRLAVLRKESAG